jgi:exodeoxyribonuclease III
VKKAVPAKKSAPKKK